MFTKHNILGWECITHASYQCTYSNASQVILLNDNTSELFSTINIPVE